MNNITSQVSAKPQKSISVDFDNNIIIKGITNMIESDEKQIIANLGDHSLIITGARLCVHSLDIEHYSCVISGSLHTLKYVKGAKKQSFIKKLFK